MPLTLSKLELLRTSNLINGQWCDSSAAASRLSVTDPSDGSQVASVPDSNALDARNAVDAAAAAFASWRLVPAAERGAIVRKWHDLIIAHQEDLGRLISREQGKPLPEGRGEVQYAASYVAWFAEQGVRNNGEVIPSPARSKRMLALREPVGIVAVVTPWNFPAAMIARKIAPALAAGCTVVAKPAEDTPLTALALAWLALEAGLPAGVLNLVCASRANAAAVVDVWLQDSRVRKLSFTGSTAVGKHLARESAGTLKRLSLELGGNAPFIVFEDADLDAAVEGLMASKFRNGGQTCVCPNRVYVHDQVHDAFVEKLRLKVGALKVGPATDTGSQIGPMINVRAIEKIEQHIRNAQSLGAQIALGGQRLQGNYFSPTILVNVSASMQCSCEETFGPVVPITRFHTEQEVLAAANATPFGLAAYFYSQNPARIWRVSEALETGIVGVNEGAISAQVAPFGGVKESGYGREGSVHGLDDYQNIKYVCQGGLT